MEPEGPTPPPSSVETAAGDATTQTISTPTLRPSARFDQTLPMELRVFIPGGRYALPQTPDDAALLRRLKRAARGWSLHECRSKYIAWAVSAKTSDAIEGFVRWMYRYYPKAAPNWRG